MRFTVGCFVLVALGAAACGDQTMPGSDADVGAAPRVFRHDPAPTLDGDQALIGGTLRYDVEHGCFLVVIEALAYPLVWPAGTEGVSGGPGVELPDGLVVKVGDHISGGGGLHHAGRASVTGYDIPAECLPSTSEVAVFNVNERVTRP